MECQHESGKGGRCKICGTLLRHDWTNETILSGAREDGDANGVAIDNSERGEFRPGKEHLAASTAVQAKGKPEAATTLDLHQNKNGKTAIKSDKRRRRKAK